MKIIPKRFRHNSLFYKMFLITILIIVTVSTLITWTTFRMSEQFFIERFSFNNSKVMNQIKESLGTFHYSIVIASNGLLNNGTMKSFLTGEHSNKMLGTYYYNVKKQMNNIKTSVEAYDVGILVYGINGISFATERPSWVGADEDLKDHFITTNTFKQPKKLLYHLEQQNDKTQENRVIVASKAFMEPTSKYIYGSMYFTIQEKDFRKFYSSYTSLGNNVLVMDQSGTILSSNRNEFIGNKETELLEYAIQLEEQQKDYMNADFKGKDHLIMIEYLPTFNLYLVNLIDKEAAFANIIDKKSIALICLLFILLAIITVFFASRSLTNSLSSLVKQIGNTPKNGFDYYIPVMGTYETRQIGQAFNVMLDELHEYVNKIVLIQKQKRNAELAALQQQINPHFLYNTLTSIKFMVQQGGKEEASETINALISLLQNTIGNISETITVRQEIDNLKSYVLINQKRYGERIRVNYFIEPECYQIQLPKLVLQPFIENSFFHGFNKKSVGTINVLVWKEADSLICEVFDNGDGMEVSADNELPDTKRKQEMFSGIGVRNVDERIQLIYGEAYGVTISSKIGEGTKVRISLPVRKK
ncbi:two-component system sensor histidine kinase YesM [Neobacillus niacini]|uniref:sensor histidine kinase n=1 Tax=Neobacillus niacini TaxID=86668 RepID=UPI00277DCF8E|nr:histidine kinase [Neobacillus niacini]MDQ1004302.1 two-component system sensor histidine kinase YesM [Neobacillus niacini]